MFALLSLWGGSSVQAPLVTMPVISVPDSTWMQRYTLTRHWPPVSELQHSWDAEMQASARCVEAPQTLMDPHGFFFFFFFIYLRPLPAKNVLSWVTAAQQLKSLAPSVGGCTVKFISPFGVYFLWPQSLNPHWRSVGNMLQLHAKTGQTCG